MKKIVLLCLLVIATNSFAAGGRPIDDSKPLANASTRVEQVLLTYSDIAAAVYADSLIQAKMLDQRISELLEQPNTARLHAARNAWLAARIPYQQSEVYRFGNELVDAWEGKVNAWPIDEGFIDYVDASSYGVSSSENPLYAINIIANERININGRMVDASVIDAALLSEVLQEAGGIETNIATGYHVIEFLLWGQDLNVERMSAGQRPASDFSLTQCSGGHCARRASYLRAVSALLIDDLGYMAKAWAPGGQARAQLNEKQTLSVIMTGIAELSFAELAGERTRLSLMLHDQEEEHDCFSDNTANSHHYNIVGIDSVYSGRYQRIDGSVVQGPSISAFVADIDSELDHSMRAHIAQARLATGVLVDKARSGQPYDWLIDENNPDGNALVQALIDRLTEMAEVVSQVSAIVAK